MNNTISSNIYFFKKRCAADKSKKNGDGPQIRYKLWRNTASGRTEEISNFPNGTKLLLILILF